MERCWLEDKEQRPSFGEIHLIMSTQLDSNSNAYGYLQVSAMGKEISACCADFFSLRNFVTKQRKSMMKMMKI
jgi:hypothetical protein